MKFVKKWDFILLAVILSVAIIALCVFLFFFFDEGQTVVVKVDGKEYARLPLNENTELLIESERGTNLLIIKDGEAWVKSASCPKQICVNHGKLSELSPIVCNHNHVSVTLE